MLIHYYTHLVIRLDDKVSEVFGKLSMILPPKYNELSNNKNENENENHDSCVPYEILHGKN